MILLKNKIAIVYLSEEKIILKISRAHFRKIKWTKKEENIISKQIK